MEDESVSSVAGDVETPVDVKGKGRAIASATDSEAAGGSGAQTTPRLGSSATLQRGAQVQSPASSDVDESWGGGEEEEDSPSKEAPPDSRTAEPASTRARNETSETKASTPRNSSEEGTSSSYDMVSAGSSPKLEKKESASTLKKDSTGANAEEDEDSDWE